MPTSNSENRAVETCVISYLGLRKAVGWIGFLLPFVLVGGNWLFKGFWAVQPSISDYYYTDMRNVLVGALCAIGVFLFSYEYDTPDNIAGNIACAFAVGVALFPTNPAVGATSLQIFVGHVHLFFAALFFLTLAYFSLFLFTKTRPDGRITVRKNAQHHLPGVRLDDRGLHRGRDGGLHAAAAQHDPSAASGARTRVDHGLGVRRLVAREGRPNPRRRRGRGRLTWTFRVCSCGRWEPPVTRERTSRFIIERSIVLEIPGSSDEYLASVPPDQRAALQHIRETIASAVPGAEEVFSYGIPAFGFEGKVVGGFAAAKTFCAFYPFSGGTTAEFADELAGFAKTQGSIHFQPDHPLPGDLVRRMVLSRVEANRRKR